MALLLLLPMLAKLRVIQRLLHIQLQAMLRALYRQHKQLQQQQQTPGPWLGTSSKEQRP